MLKITYGGFDNKTAKNIVDSKLVFLWFLHIFLVFLCFFSFFLLLVNENDLLHTLYIFFLSYQFTRFS